MSLDGIEKWNPEKNPNIQKGIYPRLEHPFESIWPGIIVFAIAIGVAIGVIFNK